MRAAELIKQVRKAAGLTQAELARRAGTSQPVISAYEHGHRDPSVSTLRRILNAASARLELGFRMVEGAGGVPPAADDTERAARLVDLLLLADAIPVRRGAKPVFPRISSH